MQEIDWCWNCFADGMSIYYDKDWILRFPKIAKDSHDWLQYLRESENKQTDVYIDEEKWIIFKPYHIEWRDLMINGFRFIIEDFTKSEINIKNYSFENEKLVISFENQETLATS